MSKQLPFVYSMLHQLSVLEASGKPDHDSTHRVRLRLQISGERVRLLLSYDCNDIQSFYSGLKEDAVVYAEK